ncbi:MAG: hypothetical protein ACR2NZ_01870 [Rubripirellula sp.]
MNPLETWLGIPPEEQPPNLYRLLGLADFESDRETIQSAQACTLEKLNSHSLTSCPPDLDAIKDQVSAAARVLLHEPQKLAYDTQLRDRLRADAKPPIGSRKACESNNTPQRHGALMEANSTEAPTGWYLRHRDGVTHGPFEFAQLVHAAKSNRIAKDTQVCHAEHTAGSWKLANSIDQIANSNVRLQSANHQHESVPESLEENRSPSEQCNSVESPREEHEPVSALRQRALLTAITLFVASCIAVALFSFRNTSQPRDLASEMLAQAGDTPASLPTEASISADTAKTGSTTPSIDGSSRGFRRTIKDDRVINSKPAPAGTQDNQLLSAARSETQLHAGEPATASDGIVDNTDSSASIPGNMSHDDPATASLKDPVSDLVTPLTLDALMAESKQTNGSLEEEEPMVFANAWHRVLTKFPLVSDMDLQLASGRTLEIGEVFQLQQAELRDELTEMSDRGDPNLIRLDYDTPEHPALLISRRGDELHGPLLSVHEQGSPLACGRYRRGKRDGFLIAWDEAGRPNVMEQYVAGKRHGLRCLLQACSANCNQGHLWMVQEWERGELMASHIVMPGGEAVTLRPSDATSSQPDVMEQYTAANAELYRFETRLSADEEQLRERVAEYHVQLRRLVSSQSRARLEASRYRSLPLGPTSPYNLARGQIGFSSLRGAVRNM